jgi:hypothetical protein
MLRRPLAARKSLIRNPNAEPHRNRWPASVRNCARYAGAFYLARLQLSSGVTRRHTTEFRMLSFHLKLRASAVAALLSFAAPASGQVNASLGPFVGYYQPLGHFDPASIYVSSLPEKPSQLRGAAWGGSGHVSIGRRFGVTGLFAQTMSRVPEVITPGGPRGPTDATVTVATLQGQYDLSPPPKAHRVWVNAGPAFVRHGGAAYAPYGSPTSLGAALGLTLVVAIASRLQVTADATGVFYVFDVPMPPEFARNPGRLEHGDQRDALLRLGLTWGHL